MTIELTTTSALLANELGDRDGYIWDDSLRKQKLDEAIDWLSQYLPSLRDDSYSTVLGQRAVAVPGCRSVISVELAGRRLNRDEAADPNTASSAALSYRMFGQVLLFSHPLLAAEAGAANLTVYAAYDLQHFSDGFPASSDAPEQYALWLVLKAAELCLLWANTVLARRGRDIGSLKAAGEYRTRLDALVAARFGPQGVAARPLKP